MAKRKSTRSRLVDRAAKGSRAKASRRKGRPAPAESEVQVQQPSSPDIAALATMALGGLQIPGLQMDNMEETVRNVVGYVQKNPVAAAAVALGAGVLLTNMYWDKLGGGTRGSR
jgi:hypothetical protein